MSQVRGQNSRLQVAPGSSAWRGPLPDLSIVRSLPARDGFVKIPLQLAFLGSAAGDLAMLVWAAIRLDFDDEPGQTSYAELANQLGIDGSPNAIKKKLGAAVTALTDAGWLQRARVRGTNDVSYQAVAPETSGRTRYGLIRRCDLALLRTGRVTPGILADFVRWQLECGRRGWTADPIPAIAARWGLTPRRLQQRRDLVAAARMLTVEERPGYPPLTWLAEVYDPHWMVPSEPTPDPGEGCEIIGTSGSEIFGTSGAKKMAPRGPKETAPPYKEPLPEGSLPEDLPVLGAASAGPSSSVTRETAPAAQAPRIERNSPDVADAGQLTLAAGELLSGHPELRSAPPHFRRAMIRMLRDAVGAGIHPGLIDRALNRVLELGAVQAHCEIVRAALREARADHLAGTCGECGHAERDGHKIGCPVRAERAGGDTPEEISRIMQLAMTSLESVGAQHVPDAAAS